MRDDFPRPVPGSALVELRQKVGVKQREVADELGIHRTQLHGWEREPEVDAVRAARYQNAVDAAYAKAIAKAKGQAA